MNFSHRIGLLPQGGQNWIAGIIYNHNLIRAIHSLPEKERPQLNFFFGPMDDLSYHKELGNLHPPSYHYRFRKNTALHYKFYEIRHSLLQLRWPYSLEGLALRIKPNVVFPVQSSLGKGFPVPWIGWIPDFQDKHFPHFFQEEEINRRKRVNQQLLEDAYQVVISSQDSYKDLKHFFPGYEKKASVLSFCSVPVEDWYHHDPQETIKKYNLPDKFLIFPSQFWIHKNHQVVFKALAILKNKGLSDVSLVCTGFTEDYRQPEYFKILKYFLKANDLEKRVFILGLLPRQEQVQLIRASVAVLQPSFFEGWSSLLEDARALGKTILVSDIPVHREQNPPDAFFFLPSDDMDLAENISRVWKSLEPGPDIEKEKRTVIEHHQRVQAYARAFIKIVKQTIQD